MSALEQLSHPTNAIDLLVTDYAMPDMTGVELVERVRAVRPDISVVLMSGYKTDGASALSNVAMLRKPFTRGELATAIAAAVVAPQQGVRP
jgi:CheY-like chemotaxis protein